MTLEDARKHLNRVREGYPMSLLVTTQALQRTGDISRLSDKPLQPHGDESSHDRAVEVESKGVKRDFSYSAYLDSPKNKGDEK